MRDDAAVAAERRDWNSGVEWEVPACRSSVLKLLLARVVRKEGARAAMRSGRKGAVAPVVTRQARPEVGGGEDAICGGDAVVGCRFGFAVLSLGIGMK